MTGKMTNMQAIGMTENDEYAGDGDAEDDEYAGSTGR